MSIIGYKTGTGSEMSIIGYKTGTDEALASGGAEAKTPCPTGKASSIGNNSWLLGCSATMGSTGSESEVVF
jgi:hypothetical protein